MVLAHTTLKILTYLSMWLSLSLKYFDLSLFLIIYKRWPINYGCCSQLQTRLVLSQRASHVVYKSSQHGTACQNKHIRKRILPLFWSKHFRNCPEGEFLWTYHSHSSVICCCLYYCRIIVLFRLLMDTFFGRIILFCSMKWWKRDRLCHNIEEQIENPFSVNPFMYEYNLSWGKAILYKH